MTDVLIYMEMIADQVEVLIGTYKHLRIGAWKDFFHRIPNGCIENKHLEFEILDDRRFTVPRLFSPPRSNSKMKII